MDYNNKTNAELIELLKEKDMELEKFKRRKTPGRKKFSDEGVIKLMYDMYLSGNGLGSIANFLNASGITPKASEKWNRSSINVILNNKENQIKFLDEEMLNNFINQKIKNTKNFKTKNTNN